MTSKPMKQAKKLARKSLNRIAARPKLIQIGQGLRILVTGDMAWAFEDGHYYEKNVEYWLVRLATELKQPVFYDIGANIGYYSIVVGAKSKHTYAFEPSQKTRKRLQLNLRLNKLLSKTTIFAYGLSNNASKAQLNIYNSNGNNSLFERKVPKEHSLKLKHKQEVELVSLDTLSKHQKLQQPDLIKIDIEGGELNALRGAHNVIKTAKPVIVFEYSVATSNDAGYKREELTTLLKALDYSFYGLVGDTDMKPRPFNKQTASEIDNVIAVPQSNDKIIQLLKKAT